MSSSDTDTVSAADRAMTIAYESGKLAGWTLGYEDGWSEALYNPEWGGVEVGSESHGTMKANIARGPSGEHFTTE